MIMFEGDKCQGCLQCGDVCPAMTFRGHSAEYNPDLCKKCEICGFTVVDCPGEAIIKK